MAGKAFAPICLFALFLAVPFASAIADEFYKGKTITFIIGSGAGGGYDTYSRLVASHIGRHLEGQPSVVPQNMPGAGSIRAANYLSTVAPKDGTTIGMVDEAIYLNKLLGLHEMNTDPAKFNWIGRVLANSAVLFARADAAVQRIQDAYEKDLIVSTSGTASKLNWTVLKNLLGLHFTIISGYQGSNDSLLALSRGEVDALSMPWSILRNTGAYLLREKKINLLLQTGVEKDPDLPQVPRMIDLARNDEERQILHLFSSPSIIGRSVLAPPGTAPERVDDLRRAFSEMLKDAAFIGDVNKAKLELNPLSGAELQAVIAGANDVPPAVIERAKEIAGTSRK